MSSSARRRLVRDFKRLQADPPAGVTAAPDDANILVWQAVIFGPDDTPWEGGTFRLEMNFSEDYPNKAPAVGSAWSRLKSRTNRRRADDDMCYNLLL